MNPQDSQEDHKNNKYEKNVERHITRRYDEQKTKATPQSEPIGSDNMPDVQQNAPKSLSSRFSVQSVSENGDIKGETCKSLNQKESSQHFSYEQPTNSTGSSSHLPKITEDVSFA